MLSKEEILKYINEDKSSLKKKIARKCLDYYEGRHDIKDYKLYYVNSDGELIEDTNRSNIKISHPFFAELVDQTVQYSLSKFSIESDEKQLDDELKEYFDDEFKDELSEVVEDQRKLGFGYMYAFVSEDDKIKFEYAEGLGIVEVRPEDNDDHVKYIIYYYVDRIDKGKKVVTKVEVHNDTQTYYYIMKNRKELEEDKSKLINPRPHKIYRDEDKYLVDSEFKLLPFFRLDNNKKQISDLRPIKDIIDDYDLMNCGLSNNLQDISEGIYVVKGFQGDSLDELQQNLKTKKVIGVGDTGDVEIKTINIPYEARKIKMETDEKNIYHFGMGFNPNQVGDGNITNIVIKSRYALLDLKCNKGEKKIRSFLKQIIQVALDDINKRKGTKYTLKNVNIILDREVMTNEVDNAQIRKTEAETRQVEVNIILDIASKLDNETVVKSICDILDIKYDDIKGKIPDVNIDLNKASEDLNDVGDNIE